MHVEPQAQHTWLAKLAGEWEYEHECEMAPGEPPVKVKGKETARMLGEVWLICEGEAEMPGGGIGRTIMTLGYDTAKGRFVGSFIGSMMTNLWPYEGQLDATGKTLVLDSEGPSFAGDGTMAKYQDSIEVVSDANRILTSRVLGAGGDWTTFMTAHYRRI